MWNRRWVWYIGHNFHSPQFLALRQFKKYQNGQWTNIDIQNKNSLLPVTKKNTIIDFQTMLHAECFYYSDGDKFKNITPLNGKISLKEIPFYLNIYKLPTPSSLSQIPSTTSTILPQAFSLPPSHHIPLSSLHAAIPHGAQLKPVVTLWLIHLLLPTNKELHWCQRIQLPLPSVLETSI